LLTDTFFMERKRYQLLFKEILSKGNVYKYLKLCLQIGIQREKIETAVINTGYAQLYRDLFRILFLINSRRFLRSPSCDIRVSIFLKECRTVV
jgi:hypothetical protein